MTRDELCGHVADVLALPLSDSQTIQTLQSRVNGADLKQLLAAALAVAREQVNQKISELESALDDSEQSYWQLEDEMRELRERIRRRAEGKRETKGNSSQHRRS
jgi:predicted  nucleic acid-binding Zn-ribbon protein